MLKDEVIEAVEKKLFAIYPIDYVDQGLEILTRPAGVDECLGQLSERVRQPDSFERLKELATDLKAFGRPKNCGKGRHRKKSRPEKEEKMTRPFFISQDPAL